MHLLCVVQSPAAFHFNTSLALVGSAEVDSKRLVMWRSRLYAMHQITSGLSSDECRRLIDLLPLIRVSCRQRRHRLNMKDTRRKNSRLDCYRGGCCSYRRRRVQLGVAIGGYGDVRRRHSLHRGDNATLVQGEIFEVGPRFTYISW